MDYTFAQDLKSIRELLSLTQQEMAVQIGVEQITISRSELGRTEPSPKLLEQVYDLAFRKGIQLNRLKEMFWTEEMESGHKLLFHGAKDSLSGPLNAHVGRSSNDFGPGFYVGESYEQAISFISGFDKSSVYLLDFDDRNMNFEKYNVDQDWMMTIAYYRGALSKYAGHPIIKDLIDRSTACDYIIAPIADNRMFQIINSFIDGEITDEQCKHCLAATNLGSQYVFKSDKSLARVKILEHCYISGNEKEHYQHSRSSEAKLGEDKVKLARVQFRGKGRYIDEILK